MKGGGAVKMVSRVCVASTNIQYRGKTVRSARASSNRKLSQLAGRRPGPFLRAFTTSFPPFQAAAAGDEEVQDGGGADDQEEHPRHGRGRAHVQPLEARTVEVHGQRQARLAGPAGAVG